MSNVRISVEGLDEFRRGLRRIDRSLGKALGAKYKEIGTFIGRLSERRLHRMSARFPSYRAGVVKIKPSANQSRAQVTIRPAAAEWGAINHPVFGQSMNQARFKRPVWPGRNREGWVLRPTIDDHDEEIAKRFQKAVDDLSQRALGT